MNKAQLDKAIIDGNEENYVSIANKAAALKIEIEALEKFLESGMKVAYTDEDVFDSVAECCKKYNKKLVPKLEAVEKAKKAYLEALGEAVKMQNDAMIERRSYLPFFSASVNRDRFSNGEVVGMAEINLLPDAMRCLSLSDDVPDGIKNLLNAILSRHETYSLSEMDESVKNFFKA